MYACTYCISACVYVDTYIHLWLCIDSTIQGSHWVYNNATNITLSSVLRNALRCDVSPVKLRATIAHQAPAPRVRQVHRNKMCPIGVVLFTTSKYTHTYSYLYCLYFYTYVWSNVNIYIYMSYECMSVCLAGRLSGSAVRLSVWLAVYLSVWTYACAACMHVAWIWMDGWMDGWIYGSMDLWWSMDLWIYGSMDLWIYVSMYLCMDVSIYVSNVSNVSMYLMYLCIYVSMYLCTYVSMYGCIYVSMYLCIYVSMYLCIYVSMYLCIYVSMYGCMDVLYIKICFTRLREPVKSRHHLPHHSAIAAFIIMVSGPSLGQEDQQ